MSNCASPFPGKNDPRSTWTKQCLLFFSWMTSFTPDAPWFIKFQPRMQPSSRGLIWQTCGLTQFMGCGHLGRNVCWLSHWLAYRFDDDAGAVGQTGDVDLGLQFAVDWSKETVWTVDAHHSFLADLHTDAALQFIHRDLDIAHRAPFSLTDKWTNAVKVSKYFTPHLNDENNDDDCIWEYW